MGGTQVFRPQYAQAKRCRCHMMSTFSDVAPFRALFQGWAQAACDDPGRISAGVFCAPDIGRSTKNGQRQHTVPP